jgi:site-specific recombinase XerC
LNYYLGSACRFLDWSVKKDYLEANVFSSIGKAEEKGEQRRIRRALLPGQLAELLEVSGPRRLVYLTACLTGLRWKELRDLVWGDVFLDHARPHIWLKGRNTKGKRADVVPLPPELVEALQEVQPPDVDLEARVFPKMMTLRSYKRDLERAGIPFLDDRGHRADFHALRVSYCSMLASSGVELRVAQRLMRHQNVQLTASVYTDPRVLDLDQAAQSLPRIAKKTEADSQVGCSRPDKPTGLRCPRSPLSSRSRPCQILLWPSGFFLARSWHPAQVLFSARPLAYGGQRICPPQFRFSQTWHVAASRLPPYPRLGRIAEGR